jgi:hypothetical protein
VTRAIERVGSLQTQYAPSGYIGLRARVEAFRREELTHALERKRVVQAWMMRATIHMATPRDFWLFLAGVREHRRRTWQRSFRRPVREVAAAARRVERFLADGPRRRGEIVKAFGLDQAIWYGVGLWLDLVRIPPFGTWEQPRADLYGLAAWWLGEPHDITEEEGIEHLLRRYLAAYGPASRADAVGWTGLPLATLDPVLRRMRLRRFVDERGAELLDLPRGPLPPADTPAPVRFLGSFDPVLLAQARRTQILPERHRGRVFDAKMPQSTHVFVLDGQVRGGWRFADRRVRLDPFEPLRREDRRSVETEAEHVAELFR